MEKCLMNFEDCSVTKTEFIFFIVIKGLQALWYVKKCQDSDITVRRLLGDLMLTGETA